MSSGAGDNRHRIGANDPIPRERAHTTLTVRLILRLGKAAVVTTAAMLVLSSVIYGSANHRDDVVAVTVVELLLIGCLGGGLRLWRGRRRAV
jgi:hypothetical protein